MLTLKAILFFPVCYLMIGKEPKLIARETASSPYRSFHTDLVFAPMALKVDHASGGATRKVSPG